MEIEELKNELSSLVGEVKAIKERLSEISSPNPIPAGDPIPTNDPDKNFVDYIKSTNIKER